MAQSQDRRSPDLLGRVRSPGLGLPIEAGPGARPRCAARADRDGTRARTASCRPTPRNSPALLDDHGLACVGGFVPVVLHEPDHDPR